jgi:hypothetical protein
MIEPIKHIIDGFTSLMLCKLKVVCMLSNVKRGGYNVLLKFSNLNSVLMNQ